MAKNKKHITEKRKMTFWCKNDSKTITAKCSGEIKMTTKKFKHPPFLYPSLEFDMECPKCGDFMIQLDYEIADAIILLNKKGYRTKYSCSGHPGYDASSFAYIMFDIDTPLDDVFKLSLPFPWTLNDSQTTIYANNGFKDYESADEWIKKGLKMSRVEYSHWACDQLLKWVKELPHNHNGGINRWR